MVTQFVPIHKHSAKSWTRNTPVALPSFVLCTHFRIKGATGSIFVSLGTTNEPSESPQPIRSLRFKRHYWTGWLLIHHDTGKDCADRQYYPMNHVITVDPLNCDLHRKQRHGRYPQLVRLKCVPLSYRDGRRTSHFNLGLCSWAGDLRGNGWYHRAYGRLRQLTNGEQALRNRPLGRPCCIS